MLIIRDGEDGDVALVLDSFVHEYRNVVYAAGLSNRQVRSLMATLLCRRDWRLDVLCDDSVPDEIVAWCVWKTKCEIAWLHVKGAYRRSGQARELLRRLGVIAGPIYTPFAPSPPWCRALRGRGYDIRHRPWMDILP